MFEIFMLFIVLWVVFISHFFYMFIKSDMDFTLTKESYKNLFSKKSKSLVTTSDSNVTENLNLKKEIVKEDIEANLHELEKVKIAESNIDLSELESGDCKRPEGFPIDLTLNDSLTAEEKTIREKVYKKIKTEPSFYKENGQKKMIVPLEAILFLNKDLNPLVNESGEIIISVKENEVIEELKEIIMSLKSNGEVLYKSDEEIIASMKVLIDLSRRFNKPIEEIGKIFKDKLEGKIEVNSESSLVSTDKSEEKEIKQVSESKKIILEEPEISEEELNSLRTSISEEPKKEPIKEIEQEVKKPKEIKQETEKPKEIKQEPVKEAKKSNLEEMGLSNEDMDSMFGDIKEEPKTSKVSSMEDMLLQDMLEMEKSVPKENKNVEKEVVDSEDKNIKAFLQKLKWSAGDNVSIDWKNIDQSLISILSNENNLSSFLRNIIKQQPIIFNDNKTVCFVDIYILHVAFAKLFGVDYDTIASKLKKMPARIFNQYKEGMVEGLGDYVSDLIINEKKITINYFQEDNVFYKSTGVWLELETFKLCLNEEEFDFFRSYPYNDKIKIGTKQNNCIPLIKDMDSTQI